MRKFLVIGFYDDDCQRWADSFEAETPEAAEVMAHQQVLADMHEGQELSEEDYQNAEENSGIIIAGVVELTTGADGKPTMTVVA